MTKFGLKCNMTYKNFMIHVLHNLLKRNIILVDLENHLILTGLDALMIEIICEQQKHH